MKFQIKELKKTIKNIINEERVYRFEEAFKQLVFDFKQKALENGAPEELAGKLAIELIRDVKSLVKEKLEKLKSGKFRIATENKKLKKPIKETKYDEFLGLSDETTLLTQKLIQSLTNDLKKENEPAPGQLSMRVAKTILGAVKGLAKALKGAASDLSQ